VAHDWGALATFNAAALSPGHIQRAVAVGVGHPGTALEIFKVPRQLHYSFHIWLFQLEGLAELALRNDDLALVDYLWDHWSSQPVDDRHVARVKETLSHAGAVEAALRYYRALVRVPFEKPDFYQLATAPAKTAMLVVFGSDDPSQVISQDEAPLFEGPYQRKTIPSAGHFVHREQPDAFNEAVLAWLQEED
jgi:pimeloyl-ACP methyl ester carboxylesterase